MAPALSLLHNQKFDIPVKPIHLSLVETFQPRVLLVGCSTAIKAKLTNSNFKANATANIHQAKKFLEIATEANEQIDAIICSASVDEKSIFHFAGFIKSNNRINSSAFLLLTGEEEIKSSLYSGRQNGIDDIISANTSLTDLIDKINLLKKYKKFHANLPYKMADEKNSFLNKQAFLKRLTDIIISSLFLLVVSPLIILIAICIKLESKGPVFYRSLRAGTNYKVFTFFKFRTMVVNADAMVNDLMHLNEYKDNKGNPFFKIKDDPRVTKVGQFLRKTSLDELPQLINVLKGDMSLVGNRPLPLYEASAITVDKSAERFLAPAGITGLWQVKGRSNEDLSVDERIKMDIDYAKKQSFLFDMKILLKTPKELILKNNV